MMKFRYDHLFIFKTMSILTSLWSCVFSVAEVPENKNIACHENSHYDQNDWSWQNVAGESTKVLAKLTNAPYALCVLKNDSPRAGHLQTSLFIAGGKEDRAAGFFWGATTFKTYLVARVNALEDNISVFQFQDQKRTLLKTIDIIITSGVWHNLELSYQEEFYRVTYDEKTVLVGNIPKGTSIGGSVGLWSKADSQIFFKNFR